MQAGQRWTTARTAWVAPAAAAPTARAAFAGALRTALSVCFMTCLSVFRHPHNMTRSPRTAMSVMILLMVPSSVDFPSRFSKSLSARGDGHDDDDQNDEADNEIHVRVRP
jgi:hypothetical protein